MPRKRIRGMKFGMVRRGGNAQAGEVRYGLPTGETPRPVKMPSRTSGPSERNRIIDRAMAGTRRRTAPVGAPKLIKGIPKPNGKGSASPTAFAEIPMAEREHAAAMMAKRDATARAVSRQAPKAKVAQRDRDGLPRPQQPKLPRTAGQKGAQRRRQSV